MTIYDDPDTQSYPDDYSLYKESICVVWDGKKVFNNGTEIGNNLDLSFLPVDVISVVTDATGNARIELGNRDSGEVTDVEEVSDVASNKDWWSNVTAIIS